MNLKIWFLSHTCYYFILFLYQFPVENHWTAPTSHTMHGMLDWSGRSQSGPCRMDRSQGTISLVILWVTGLIYQLISVLLRALLPPFSPLFQSSHSLSTHAHCQPLMKWDRAHQLSAHSPPNKLVKENEVVWLYFQYWFSFEEGDIIKFLAYSSIDWTSLCMFGS